MANLRAQVTLRTTDDVPANFITNSWAFTGTSPVNDVDDITAALDAFYTSFINFHGAKPIAGTGHSVKYYDLPGVRPNYPQWVDTFDTGASSSTEQLPSECAIVMSFQGLKIPGEYQRRRRGRIYLGTCRASDSVDGRPKAALLTDVASYASTFMAAIDAISTDTAWAVWSSTSSEGVAVDNGWVDNAWDTQRRRGIQSTSRTTFS